MKSSYLLPGYGGEYECENGHQGATVASRGIPARCLTVGCDARTVRIGDGSREANQKLEVVRRNRAALTAAARAARA